MAQVRNNEPANRLLVEMFVSGDRTSVVHVVDAASTSRVLGYIYRCRSFYAADRLAVLNIELSNAMNRDQNTTACIKRAHGKFTTSEHYMSLENVQHFNVSRQNNARLAVATASKAHRRPATPYKTRARKLAARRR